MKPLPWPSALRTLCLSWVMVCSMFGVAHAQGPAVITDPHQQVEQLMRQDQIEPALAKIQAHLAQRPRDPQMRFWQAVLLTRQGKREQAMQVYTALTQDFPELAEPHNNLGVLQAANNDIDLAQRSFELALRADPSMPWPTKTWPMCCCAKPSAITNGPRRPQRPSPSGPSRGPILASVPQSVPHAPTWAWSKNSNCCNPF